MRRYGALVLLAAVAAALVWWGGTRLGGSDPFAPAPPELGEATGPLPSSGPPQPEPEEPAASPPEDPTLAGAGGPRRAAGMTAEKPEVPAASERDDNEAVLLATYAGEMPVDWSTARPAQLPHAIRPPMARGPRLGGGRGRGGMGPTGHWTRFPPPPPPRGTSTLHVRVSDRAGQPLSGADLYLGPPASLRESAVSFGDLRKIGQTGPAGTLTVRDLPAGAAALAGNVGGLLNRPRGLDMRSSIPILLLEGAAVRARIELPFESQGMGRATGRVVDAEDRPIPRASVVCGFSRVYADEQGVFEVPHLRAGTQILLVSRTGYETAQLEVEVPRDGAIEVLAVLGFRETGSLSLAGRVLAAEGGGVAGAALYLIDEGGRGTLRSVRSDADGRYHFDALPERLGGVPVRVQAGKHQDGYRASVVRFEGGLTDTQLDIELPPRQVRARFLLRDAADGSPVDRCRIEPARLDDATAPVRGFLGSNREGIFEHWFDAGRYRFQVEAPDHERQSVDADLNGPGTTVDLEVRMTPRGSEAAAVTLRVVVKDAFEESAVTSARIELLDEASGTEVARFEGEAEDGRYSLPAPSGAWRLRVSATGYESAEQALHLAADAPEATVTAHLRPR